MHTVTIFPLGNADCTRIDLQGGKKILFDFRPSEADNAASAEEPEGGM